MRRRIKSSWRMERARRRQCRQMCKNSATVPMRGGGFAVPPPPGYPVYPPMPIPVGVPPTMSGLGFLGETLPKPRSTTFGPLPVPGTWPEYRGSAGPKQKACVSNSGVWIGPTGKKWCQLPLAAASPGDPIYYPPGTGPVDAPPYLGVPAPPAPPLTDTAIIPPGGDISNRYPDIDGGPSDLITDLMLRDPGALEGPNGGDTRLPPLGASPQIRGMSTAGKVFMFVAVAGLGYYFVKKRKKRGKK